MGSIIKVTKYGKPKDKKHKIKIKCQMCDTKFIGEYHDHEICPEWTCPGCGRIIDNSGKLWDLYDDDD